MCGIAGIINLDGKATYQARSIHRMTNAMKHRGPNDEGYFLQGNDFYKLFYGDDTPNIPKESRFDYNYPDDHILSSYGIPSRIALGHRRLSIIDLSFSGHQPMGYLNRYWIVYNGEVYNYIELRQELEAAGYHFHSKTDTEVIMAAYDKWGSSCLERFNGMWAFVIYDSGEDKLFISRDRFGIKPLYYYMNDRMFVFASEIKSLLANEEIKTSPNFRYCRDYIRYGPQEYLKETAFDNILRFDRASYLEVKTSELKTFGVTEKKFWDYTPNLCYERYNERKAYNYARQYYDLLEDAIRIRLRADVIIGTALSGGLDSSTIAYIINQHLRKMGKNEKQETFSSVYKTEGAQHCDESAYINELVRWLDVNSNEIEPQLKDIISEHGKMIYAMENPAVGMNMGGWYTFKRVQQSGVIVNLDGQGADEQLAGYFKYLWRHFINMPLRDIPREVKACFHLPGIEKSKILISILINISMKVLGRKTLIKVLKMVGIRNPASGLAAVNEALYNDTMNCQLTNLLHFGDSQSMAHSVESRLPFMDYRLVEFLASVPATYKIHNGWTKYIARLALDKKLPDNITWRKDKMGWPDPTDYWLRGDLKEWMCREIESSVFLKHLGVDHDIRKRASSNEDISNLVRLLNLSVWHKTFFDEASFKKSQGDLSLANRKEYAT